MFLADDDAELNYYAVGHAKEYAEYFHYTAVEIICSDLNAEQINTLNTKKFPVHVLHSKESNALLSYLLLKATVVGVSIIPNCCIVSLNMFNEELRTLYELEIFDKEYLVWYKMFFFGSPLQKELKRIPAFSNVI